MDSSSLDQSWLQYLPELLGENKTLTLSSGEHLLMNHSSFKLILETGSLKNASPTALLNSVIVHACIHACMHTCMHQLVHEWALMSVQIMVTVTSQGRILENLTGGGRHKIMPYSDNGLLKVVILFLLYNTFQWQLIFFLKPREGDRPPCPTSKYGPASLEQPCMQLTESSYRVWCISILLCSAGDQWLASGFQGETSESLSACSRTLNRSWTVLWNLCSLNLGKNAQCMWSTRG